MLSLSIDIRRITRLSSVVRLKAQRFTEVLREIRSIIRSVISSGSASRLSTSSPITTLLMNGPISSAINMQGDCKAHIAELGMPSYFALSGSCTIP